MSERTTTFDTVLDLCRDPYRRIVLGLLADHQQSLTVNDLTKAVVKHNHHESISEVSPEVLARIQTELMHTHIPKVEDTGVIKFDSKRRLVEPTEQFDQFQPYLSAVIDADPALETPLEL